MSLFSKKQSAPISTDACDELKRRHWAVRLLREYIIPFAVMLAVLLPFRSAIADWNDVPTGSMEPTILPGDRIWVNKLAYGLRVPFTNSWITRWNDPRAGEIVVFDSPADGVRLVKRLVAGPGDTVELRDNRLLINNAPAAYSPLTDHEALAIDAARQASVMFAEEKAIAGNHAIMLMPKRAALRNFGPVKVPDGQYFAMGDSRDNSGDSRVFGFVRRDLIAGRSSLVAISFDPDRYYLPRFGRWVSGLR